MLILMAGLPGTGKSTLARALAPRLDGVVLDKDTLRTALFPPAGIEYSAKQDDFCMEIMLDVARYVMALGIARAVFLDGRTFSQSYQIERAIQGAGPASWRILECTCPEELAVQRIEQDLAHPAGNRGVGLYRTLRDSFEPITRPKLVVDTSASLEECVERCLGYLV
jgi:adenylylsulfate kinase